jgi:hypothetical protein
MEAENAPKQVKQPQVDKKKTSRIDGAQGLDFPHLSITHRRNWHLAIRQVAGFHRAVPSTTLDKAV